MVATRQRTTAALAVLLEDHQFHAMKLQTDPASLEIRRLKQAGCFLRSFLILVVVAIGISIFSTVINVLVISLKSLGFSALSLSLSKKTLCGPRGRFEVHCPRGADNEVDWVLAPTLSREPPPARELRRGANSEGEPS